MSSNSPAPEDSTGASWTLVAAAAIVGVVVVLGLVLTVLNLLGNSDEPTVSPSAVPTDVATPSASSTPAAAEASICGLPAVELSGSVNVAPAATWTLVGTTAAPAIAGQGPGNVEADGYRSCYARTPTGALLAAANYSALGSYDPVRRKFYEQATVPGPGRDALLKEPVPGSGSGGTRVQIAGFRLLRYDGVQADVDIAFRTSNGAIGATVLNLEWSGGDWKIRLAEDGSELSPFVQLPSLGGYVLWSGA